MKTTQELVDNVLFHKTTIIKNVIAAIIMVAIFAFEGCFNFATLTWDITNLENPAFWVKVGTKVILFIAIKTIALLTFLDIARKTNTNLQSQKKTNDDLMKLKESDFPMYVENVLNPSIKVEAWKKKVHAELLKLEKHAKIEDRSLYFTENRDLEKRNNSYCIKRTELEKELTDSWIEKNINVLPVNGYAVIEPSVFDKPVTVTKENKYQLTSKTKTAVAITMSFGIIGLLISQTLWTATGVKPLEEYNALEILISMLMDLIFLVWQFFTGVTKAFSTINNEEVIPYVNRNRILKEYSIWKTGDNTEMKSKVEKWINILENENNKVVEKKEA